MLPPCSHAATITLRKAADVSAPFPASLGKLTLNSGNIKNAAMTPVLYISESESQTRQLAHALAAVLPDSVLLTLEGPLGAGKTCFVRFLAEAWEIAPQSVVSPTFAICQTYQGTRSLHHLDAYRLRSADELDEIVFDELLDESATVVIEWASRIQERLPESRLECTIDLLDIDRRRFSFSALGGQAESLGRLLSVAIERIS